MYAEYFVRGTEPVDYCDLHTTLSAPRVVAGAAVQPVAVDAPVPPAVAPPPIPTPVATTGIVAAGTPEDIVKSAASHTGKYLKKFL